MSRVLVAGIPRSGTTWLAEVLGLAENATLVPEPDNPDANPQARPVRRSRGMHPVVDPDDPAPDYAAIWDLAFAGGWPLGGGLLALSRALRRLPPAALDPLLRATAPLMARARPAAPNVVVKSVFVTFSVEWLVARYQPAVVVMRRDPLNVIASWLDLGIPIGDLEVGGAAARYVEALALPPPDLSAALHERVAWSVGFLTTMEARLLATHPEWPVMDHAALIADPESGFRMLFERLGLGWTGAVLERIAASDRPGSGYQTSRVRSELPQAWRRRLTGEQVAAIRGVLERFGLAHG